MKSFLHVSFRFEGPRGDVLPLIEATFNKASDWIRYAPNCWILYTSTEPDGWFRRLMRVPGLKTHEFFICELNLQHRSGYLDESVWNWIDKYSSLANGNLT